MAEIKIIPNSENQEKVTAFIEACLDRPEVSPKTASQMAVAADEIFSNVVRYSGARNAVVGCEIAAGEVRLTFTDDGKPYDPTKAEVPDVTLSAEERKIGGLGIFMVRKLMDDVVYAYVEEHNVLIVRKKL